MRQDRRAVRRAGGCERRRLDGPGFGNPEWLASLETPWNGDNRALALAYEFLRFPDFIGVVVVPWARNAPVLGVMLLALLALASLRVIAAKDQPVSDERVLLLLIVCLLAAASLSDPPRFETRYVFFLYPAAIVIGIAFVARAFAGAPGGTSAAPLATTLVVAAGFYTAGDLQPRRLLAIDAAENNFGMAAGMGGYSNVLNRSDPRGAAEWLAANAGTPDTVVINGIRASTTTIASSTSPTSTKITSAIGPTPANAERLSAGATCLCCRVSRN